jgi:hypothetical protein
MTLRCLCLCLLLLAPSAQAAEAITKQDLATAEKCRQEVIRELSNDPQVMEDRKAEATLFRDENECRRVAGKDKVAREACGSENRAAREALHNRKKLREESFAQKLEACQKSVVDPERLRATEKKSNEAAKKFESEMTTDCSRDSQAQYQARSDQLRSEEAPLRAKRENCHRAHRSSSKDKTAIKTCQKEADEALKQIEMHRKSNAQEHFARLAKCPPPPAAVKHKIKKAAQP